MWTSDANAQSEFSKLFSSSWLFIYVVFLFPFNLLFVEKVDYRVDFYKNISDSPEDIKDKRWSNS